MTLGFEHMKGEEVAAFLHGAKAERARRDFSYFCDLIFPDYDIQWFQRVLIQSLQETSDAPGDQRLGISMPPGHAKTTYCAAYIAWQVARDSEIQIKYVTYNQDRASHVLEKDIKPILQSDVYVHYFGHKINAKRAVSDGSRGEANNKTEFEIVGGTGWVQACGFGGGITGGRCDVIVIDDPFKGKSDSSSPAEREKRWAEYGASILTRKRPGRPLKILMPFTRWHLDDLCGRARKIEPEAWRWIEFEALREERGYIPEGLIMVDDPRNEGEALWPAIWSEEELLATRRQRPEIFSALFQQRPVADGGSIVSRDFFLERWSHLPASHGRWIQSWDMRGGGKTDRGSFAVGILAFLPNDEPGRCYIVGLSRERWTPAETITQFCAKNDHPIWARAGEKLVEKKADGIQVLSQCAPLVPGLIEVQPSGKGNKEQRLRAVAHFLRAGNVIIPERADWLNVFIDEVCDFPMAPNDDIVDALSQLLDYIWGATQIQLESERARQEWDRLMAA